MRTARLLLLVFLAMPLHAQAPSEVVESKNVELPDAPQPHVNKKLFLAGVTALAAAKSFDMRETSAMLARGDQEFDPLLGAHPSNARIQGTAAAVFSLEAGGFYFTERSHHAWVRWSGRALLVLAIEEHLRLGACDAKLQRFAPASEKCHALLPL